MKNISAKSNYLINPETLALLPARHIEYNTIVLERDRSLFVKETPFNIVKQTCIANWSSYIGRRTAVTENTGFKHKVPIPFEQFSNKTIFPTHSPKHLECCWVVYGEHVYAEAYRKQTILHLGHNQQFILDASPHGIKTQIERAFQVAYQVGGEW